MNEASAASSSSSSGGGQQALPDPLSILLVGEGNLSFTHALVRRLSRSAAFRRATQDALPGARGSAVTVVTTTFDSEAELATKYPESTAICEYFAAKQRVPVRYVGSVNATAISSTLGERVTAGSRGFHVVVFNNPHIGFEDLYRQRSLLSHFFASTAELVRCGPALSHPQEVVVAVCDDQAQRWDLLGCAARSGYVCVAAQPLLPADYPEYTNRRHQSDAAFPFQRMVQYWFVQPTPELQAALGELRGVVERWAADWAARLSSGEPCAFSCAAWLRVADTFGIRAAAADASVASAPPSSPPSRRGDGCTGASPNYVACDSTTPLPLLDPHVAAAVLARFVLTAGAAALSPTPDAFSPYFPSAAWAALYEAQWEAETHYRPVDGDAETKGEATTGGAPQVPPHLDAAVLGRPLTTKEAKKLQRYMSGYGAAMKAKALEQRRAAAAASEAAWSCTDCAPPRCFDSEQDLQQHRASKHAGAVQLAPTLYARVHQQIAAAPSAPAAASLEVELAGMTLDDDSEGSATYCAVCGLQYTSADAFAEHLRYLSPLPGDTDVDLTCVPCDPPKRFTDRRGLEQHRSSKHTAV